MNKFYKATTHNTTPRKKTRMGDTANFTEDGEFPVLCTSKVTNRYTLFVDNTLSGPQDARFIVQALSNANEDDEVALYLSSGGGSVAAGQMIIQAMQHCAAPIVVIGSGDICSMAAIILCSCESFVLDPHAGIMLHSASGGYSGSMGDIESYAKFQREQLSNLLDYYCIGVLTEAELNSIHNEKKEIWLTTEQFITRFKRKMRAQEMLSEYIEEADIDLQAITPTVYIDLMKGILKQIEEEDQQLAAKATKKPRTKKQIKDTSSEEASCSNGLCSKC